MQCIEFCMHYFHPAHIFIVYNSHLRVQMAYICNQDNVLSYFISLLNSYPCKLHWVLDYTYACVLICIVLPLLYIGYRFYSPLNLLDIGL